MRVFVTGASGWIGSAVVPELLAAGHQVAGLARSDAAAATIAAAGAEVVRGSLEQPATLQAGAAEADGVVHLAFIHDFTDFEHSVRTDLRAIEALGAALAGSDRPFLVASGVLGLAPGRVATEHDVPDIAHPRALAAQATRDLARRGIRSSVVRFAPTVHGRGDGGFVPMLIGVARAKGVSAYVGEGANCWPAVHRFDAAPLVRLALERAPAGSTLHAVAEQGVATRTIAETLGRHLGVPVTSIAPDEAVEHFGWLGGPFAMDVKVSNAITREMLGWSPAHPELLADLDEGHYFDEPGA